MYDKKSIIVIIGVVFVSFMLVGSIGIESKNLKVSDSVVESSESNEKEKLIIVDLKPVDYSQNEDIEVLKKRVKNSQAPLISRYKNTSGVKVIDSWWITNAIMIKVNFSTAGVKSLSSDPKVENIISNKKLKIPEPIKDSAKSQNSNEDILKESQDYSKGFNQMKIKKVRDKMGLKGNNVRVTVLDTGVNANLSQITLAPNNPWKDFIGNLSNPRAPEKDTFIGSHGTHASALINAESIDGIKVGIAPESNLAVGRVCESDGCDLSSVLSGIEWAVNTNSDVLSTSLGSIGTSKIYQDAIKNTFNSGVVFVASSGNDGDDTSATPANSYDVIGVGSTNEDRTISEFSSGDLVSANNIVDNIPSRWPSEYVQPDVVAPGRSVKSISAFGRSFRPSGTSFSGPQVAGVAALMIESRNGKVNVSELNRALRQTADKPISWDEELASHSLRDTDSRYGNGIVNAIEAIRVYSADKKTISGYVEDKKGNRIKNAKVSQVGQNISTMTRPNGKYKLILGPGEDSIKVNKFGLEKKTKSVKNTNVVNFELGETSDAKKMGINKNKTRPNQKLKKLYKTKNVNKVFYSLGNKNDNVEVAINGQKVDEGQKVNIGKSVKIAIKLNVSDRVLSSKKSIPFDVSFTGKGENKIIREDITFSEKVRNVLIINDNKVGNREMSKFVSNLEGLNYNVYSSTLNKLKEGKRHNTIILNTVKNINNSKINQLEKASSVLIALSQRDEKINGIDYLSKNSGSPSKVIKEFELKDRSIVHDIKKSHPILRGNDKLEIYKALRKNEEGGSAFELLVYSTYEDSKNDYNILSNLKVSDEKELGNGIAIHKSKNIVLLPSFGFYRNAPRKNYKEGSRTLLSSIITQFSDQNNFNEPLPGFKQLPKNTGQVDPILYEDLNGDNDGLGTDQTVRMWSELVIQDGLNFTDRQAELLNWNKNSPPDKVTPEDMVSLWSEQVIKGNG